MQQAWLTLAGTLVGALLVAVVQVWQNRRADQRATLDRAEARAARLFDHRRNAYAEFVATARHFAGWIDAAAEGWTAEPDGEDWDPLEVARINVMLYGSEKAGQAANQVAGSMTGYIEGEPAPSEPGDRYSLLRAFVDRARKDLGVTSG